jgi:RNA polymerase sigma factor (sigma-70 family)
VEQNDVQLIQRILQGDQEAFSPLVKKYQQGVHALVWRKIGDFHIAQEITQDAFLQAYRKLGTLKNPTQFSGWLYVIAANLCRSWFRKNRMPVPESLEATEANAVDRVSYSQYVAETQEADADEARREVVKKLLQKLPESERTVMTLHYLGEMTIKSISEFLGVSQNTIKSRLSRARNRLRKEEDVIQQNLGSFQFPDSLTENVMRHIAELSPTAPPPSQKPLLPLAALGAAAILAILFGIGGQYLLRFQVPYSFDADAEPTIEIVEEPIYFEILAKPAVRNQIGRTSVPSENSGAGMQTAEPHFTANASDNTDTGNDSQWTQGIGPTGSIVYNIFESTDGTLYAAAKTGLYKLTPDATWVLLNTDIPIGQYRIPITEHQGTLYTVSADEVLASENGGETWNALGPRPKGVANGLIVTESPETEGITLSLALQEKGIFRSTDTGQHWMPLNTGLTGKRIYSFAAVGNTFFAGTHQGLYRLDSNEWHQLLTGVSDAVYAVTVNGSDLYVGTGRNIIPLPSSNRVRLPKSVDKKIFHSADLGTSWTDITPIDASQVMHLDSALQILAVDKTLFVLGVTEFRSRDGGKTWTRLRSNLSSRSVRRFPAIAIDENTFYKADPYGISRTTDAGETWHPFVKGMTGPVTYDLIALNQRRYMHIGGHLVHSTDAGETWKHLRFNTDAPTPTLDPDFYARIKLTTANNRLYGISIVENRPSLFRTSDAGDELIPLQGVPAFKAEPPPDRASDRLRLSRKIGLRIRAFAVWGETFYVNYQEKLYKWHPGNTEWTDTGLGDLGFGSSHLAVSGETVYASKRDYVGKTNGTLLFQSTLFQSLDGGNSWKDITATLPSGFARFKAITFIGSSVCVATNKGVFTSHTGEHWRVITDKNRMPIIIEKFATDGTTLYGVGKNGAYRLDAAGDWDLISSEVPNGSIKSLVISNNQLYIATHSDGIFHISLEEQMDIANSF